jgi:sarcosine oxidase/L-pipecolate oxidase
VLVANRSVQFEEYLRTCFENVERMMEGVGDRDAVRILGGRGEIEKCVGTGGGSGDLGYVNWRSGWADAEGGMRWLRKQVEGTGRVEILCEEVQQLVREGKKVVGVKTKGGNVSKGLSHSQSQLEQPC